MKIQQLFLYENLYCFKILYIGIISKICTLLSPYYNNVYISNKITMYSVQCFKTLQSVHVQQLYHINKYAITQYVECTVNVQNMHCSYYL